MKSRIVIIAGSPIDDLEFLRRQLAVTAPDAVLCADGGAFYARQLGIVPDLIIGDMDSLDEALLRDFAERGGIVERHPVRKDETDTQLAVERALAIGAEEIIVFGALGKRLDHTLANIGLLLMGLEKGVPIVLRDESCDIYAVAGTTTIKGEAKETVSLFPLGGDARGITLEGFEYDLADAAMTMSRPYGISNRLLAREGRISVKQGYLLVIHYLRGL